MTELKYGVSPMPSKKKVIKEMSFPEALLEVMKGKRVTKLEWDDQETYIHVQEQFLCIHNKGDEQTHALLIKEVDLRGTDWVVIDEKFEN